MRVPSPGEITVLEKSIVPVKNAKVVASILFGVILANNAIIGNVYNKVIIILNTTSVKNKK